MKFNACLLVTASLCFRLSLVHCTVTAVAATRAQVQVVVEVILFYNR